MTLFDIVCEVNPMGNSASVVMMLSFITFFSPLIEIPRPFTVTIVFPVMIFSVETPIEMPL